MFLYVRVNVEKFGIKNVDFDIIEIYVYVFEGVVLKDGLSVGVIFIIVLILVLVKIFVL